jgi:hypothetical protein
MSVFARTITPTRVETMLYIFVSVFSLLVINLTTIASLFVSKEVITTGAGVAGERVRAFTTLIDNLSLTSTVALAFFWALFGTVLYTIGATFYELWSEAKHELAEVSGGTVHHPRYLTSTAFAGQLIGRSVLRIVALVLIVTHSLVVVGFVLPLSSQLVRDVTFARDDPWLVLSPIAGVLLFALTLHLFTVLLRLLFLRPRLVSTMGSEDL